jgi:putative ABC transport system ATP-binding protein
MNKVIMKTKDLCKTFVSGKEGFNAIKNVNIGIYEKEFTVIMGSSGSGKVYPPISAERNGQHNFRRCSF